MKEIRSEVSTIISSIIFPRRTKILHHVSYISMNFLHTCYISLSFLPILPFLQFEFEYVLIFLYCKQPQPSQYSKEPYECAWVFVYVFQVSSLYPFSTPRVHITKVEINNPTGTTWTLMNKNDTPMKENVTPTNDTKTPMKETQAPSEPPSFKTNMMNLDSQVEM